MKWTTFIFILLALLFSQPVIAEEEKADNVPWEKFSLQLGYFLQTFTVTFVSVRESRSM